MGMSQKEKKRSCCPIACGLDLFGDRWTLLVIRDLYFGRCRFKELSSSPEAPPTNILAERLNRLLKAGIVRQVAANDGTKHRAYELTSKGMELLPLLEHMRDWGLKWIPHTKAMIGKSG
jgi:DNA-binding HxlR family transcriptional regulator